MRANAYYLLIILIVMVASCKPNTPIVEKVSFEQLMGSPKNYAGKTIEVNAILYLGEEAMFLSDLADKKNTEIWFEYADLNKDELEARGFYAFSRIVSPFNNESKITPVANVYVVGKFDYAKTPNQGFGHLGAFKSQLSVERIIKVILLKEKLDEQPKGQAAGGQSGEQGMNRQDR